ncbi:MAG: sulfatase [Cyclobacteriaceae bacterium]|nr:sulfatase [Cyclobacteriaceae bacterium]MDH4295673.1 sulfatase [Cyclobacteriaceae bacterium]MDH5249985.1 sulfatase [Cyclobacteriaceae bacterium]
MKMNRNALPFIFLMIFIGAELYAQQPDGKKPNIVFILADDLGYFDLSCYGNPYNNTPNIDRLATDGLLFKQAYVASPVCSPSRAAILTAKHPARLHLTNFLVGNKVDSASRVLPAKWRPYLPGTEITLAEHLKALGYRTGMVGKWHLGYTDSTNAVAQGFDYDRVIGKNGLDYYNYGITSKNRIVFEDTGTYYLTDRLTDYGVEFIKGSKAEPFFLFLSYSAPHVFIVPRGDKLRKYFLAYNKHDGKYNPYYAAMLESLDDGVGRILETLATLGLEENTLVVFTSDNGGVGLPELGPMPTNMEPLRAWKGHVYEGGIRIPLLIKWPGHIRSGGVTENYITGTDYLPTFMEILGKPIPYRIDGMSFLGTLYHPEVSFNRGPVFWHYPHFSNQEGRPAGALRLGDYKLIENYETGELSLYNLKDDISEEHDLGKRLPEKRDELLALFTAWKKETDANMPIPNPNFKEK